ncbi:MAG: phosphate acyltransferase PlsX [Parasporobacterium sp.]|nr:phosphate acyltransferase PlsX [Parasporobacterium sp.]
MSENRSAGNVIIALDAMGGDFAPQEHVKGAVEAAAREEGFILKLFGDQERLAAELSRYQYNKERIEIVPCGSVVENCEVPTVAIRKKKDSSMVMGLYALRNEEAQAFISCGNTGAILVGGQTIVGRIKGVDRAGLAFLLPSAKSPVLLLDSGANVDVKPEMILQFAQMGSIYMESVLGVPNPRVGLINIGEEKEKGNKLVHESFPLLQECTTINFTGSVETRGLTEGQVDVAVCDGFVGNIILKTYEGVAANMLQVIKGAMMKNAKTKAGALLMKSELKQSMKQFSVEEYGGAPLLGIKKLVVKTHGNSKAAEIRNTILQCSKAVREDLTGKIERTFYGI